MSAINTAGSGEYHSASGFAGLRIRQQQGVALMISLIMLVLISLLTITALRMSVLEEKITGNQKLAANALFAAEQSASHAIADLLAGSVSHAGFEADATWQANGNVTSADYHAAFTVSHMLAGGAVVDEDGRSFYRINARGTSGPKDTQAYRELDVGVTTLEKGVFPFASGLVGCEGIDFDSNVTTSSYSSSGAPGSGDKGDARTTNTDALIELDSNARIEGELRSTGTLSIQGDSASWVRRDVVANNAVDLEGDFTIYGSVYSNTTVTNRDDKTIVHGDVNQGPSVDPDPVVPLVPCDPLDIDAIFTDVGVIKTSNDNGELNDYCPGTCFDGADYQVEGGDNAILGVDGEERDYYFEDFAMDTDSSGSVTIHGSVRIYIDGRFHMKSDSRLFFETDATLIVYVKKQSGYLKEQLFIDSNSMANFLITGDGGIPSNFQIYTDAEWNPAREFGNEPVVRIDSNSGFYGIVYAPGADVVLDSNARFSGALRGLHVTLDSNAVFVYDEDVKEVGTGHQIIGYNLLYWNEIY